MDILNSNLYHDTIKEYFIAMPSYLFLNTALYYSSFKLPPFPISFIKFIFNSSTSSFFIIVNNYNLHSKNHYLNDVTSQLLYLYYYFHISKINNWRIVVNYYTYHKLAQKISLNQKDFISENTLIMAIMISLFYNKKLKRFLELIQQNDFAMSLKNQEGYDLLTLTIEQAGRKLGDYEARNLSAEEIKNKIFYQKIINYLLTLKGIEPNNISIDVQNSPLNIKFSILDIINNTERFIYYEKDFANKILKNLIENHAYNLNRKIKIANLKFKFRHELNLEQFDYRVDYKFILSLGAKLQPSIIATLTIQHINLERDYRNLRIIFEYFLRRIRQDAPNSTLKKFSKKNLRENLRRISGNNNLNHNLNRIHPINHFYTSKILYDKELNVTLPMMAAYVGIEEIVQQVLNFPEVDINLYNRYSKKNMLIYALYPQYGKSDLQIFNMIVNSGKLRGNLSFNLLVLIVYRRSIQEQHYILRSLINSGLNFDLPIEMADGNKNGTTAKEFILRNPRFQAEFRELFNY